MMSEVVIKVEGISKQYRLGKIGTGSITHDFNRWFNKIQGKEDPYIKIGDVNDRSIKGDSDYVWSLRDVSFEIERGDAIGIIGKNGAGKSTLLKILSQITTPTSGLIKIKGRIASLLEVGTGFHPELTGRENIYLNGAILGMTKREISRKFDEIVDFAGVERYIDTPVKRYSSGMYVRLAFGVAAHLEPEILIVDEVLAVGDAEFQKKALGKMQDVSKGEGRTVLFVSHNMAAVKNLCQKGILLKNGQVASMGKVENVLSDYLRTEKFENISLSERSDRYGNKNFYFTGISFLDKDSKNIESTLTREFLRIKLSYKLEKDLDLSQMIIGLNFRDEYENDVLSFISDEMGSKFSNNSSGSFYLEIPSLLLRGSVYSVRLFASYMDTNPENICDSIDNAAYLKVESIDFWGTGKLLRDKKEAILDARYY